MVVVLCFFFFFQAEDGIRDVAVTGVQTCALPILFSEPRQIDSESALYDAAIKILMRRAHSVHEMKQALERRCENQSLVRKVMTRLKSAGLIDDARYASLFVRHRTESRKQGKFRIARDLRARGVPDRHIEAALWATAQQIDEADR